MLLNLQIPFSTFGFVFSREFCALQKIFFETIHTTRINQERESLEERSRKKMPEGGESAKTEDNSGTRHSIQSA